MRTMTRVVEEYKAPEPRLYDRPMDWLLAAYVILLPVQIDTSDVFHLALSDIALMLMVAGVALGMIRLRHVPSAWSIWHAGMVFSFALATVVALIRTGHASLYALVVKDIGLLALFAAYAIVVGEVGTWARARWLARLLILSVAIQNVVFVLGSMAHWTSGLTVPGMGFEKDRLAGMLIDPNAYGGLLVMTLSIHLMTYCGNRPLVGGLLGKLVTMSLAIGVVLTYSRSAWLGLALLFLAAMIMRPKAGVYMVLMGLLAVALTLKGFGPDYASRMSELTFRGAQVHERVELIDQAIPLFRESPAFGIGMGVFNDIYGNIIHNTPVWILTECGVFGFIIFVGFAWWFLARGIDALRVGTEAQRSLVLGLMLANLAMMGLSMGIEALYQRHWWVVLALLAACYDLTRVQCRRPAVGG